MRLTRAFLLVAMASLLLRAEAQNATDNADLHLRRDDACVAGALDLVDRGCATWRETTPRSHTPIWGALINITRDCNLDHTQSEPDASVNSFGLGSWVVGIQAAFQDFVSRFDAESGLSSAYRNRTVGEYISNWVEAWPTASNPGPIDWWMLGSEVFGEDLDHGAFLDLTEILMGDESYGFSDIPVQFRDAGSSAYAGRYTSLPLVLTPYNLLYRRDIFEQYNLSVPATWDDALDIADKYGRGALGPGQPDLGFCFESNPACGYAHAMVIYILASMVQLKGASDGAWFDPVTVDPLYTSPAMREALRIYGALRNHSVPDSTPCGTVTRMLASGRCLMLWSWSFTFKRASHNSSSMSGRQGVAGTPGSAVVMDRSTGRMGPCTREACPSAREERDPRTGGSRLVNQVVPVDGISFGINRFSPAHRQGAAYAMLSAFTAPAEHFRAALLPYTEVSPIRYRELDAREWISAGYNPADLDDFLAQHRISFDSENVYYELRIPGTFQTYTLVQYLLYRYNANNYTYEELMSWASEGTERIFASLGGRDRLRPLYQGSIGYKPAPPPAPSSGGSSSATLLIAVLVPSLVSLVLLGGALWAYLRCARLRDERRARLSAAPGAGPGTTLLVTDIQDSTCLWESLPASVMDVALKTHHRVIRQLLIQHAGYESATEGDSFILAFAKPDRALAFALSAQDALLAAEWPGELLDSAHAPTLVVTRDTTACAAAQLSIAGPAIWKEVFDCPVQHEALLASVTDSKTRLTRRASMDSADVAATSQARALEGSEHSACTTSPFRTSTAKAPPAGRLPGGPAETRAAAHLRWADREQSWTSAEGSPGEEGQESDDRTPPAIQPPPNAEAEPGASSLPLGPDMSGLPWGASGAAARSRLSSSGAAADRASPPPRQHVKPRMSVDLAPSGRVLRPPRPGLPVPSLPPLAGSTGTASRPGAAASRHRLSGSSTRRHAPPSADVCTPEAMISTGGDTRTQEPAKLDLLRSAPHLEAVKAAGQAPGDVANLEPSPAPVILRGLESLGSDALAPTNSGMRPASAYATLMDERERVTESAGSNVAATRGVRAASGSGVVTEDSPGLGGGATSAKGRPSLPALTLREALGEAFPAAHSHLDGSPAPGAVLFRGLRVRMGMHCGLGEAEVADNKASGRITYPGRALQMAKAVSDAGRGGHVTLSSAVLGALDPRPGHVHYSGPYLVLQGGKRVLKEGQAPVDVLCAFSCALLPRAGHMEGLRCASTQVPGTLQAPLGLMAVALAQVEDPDEFAGWGLEASLASHKALLGEAARLAVQHGGYLVHTPPGSFQAAFTSPAAALAWLMNLQEDLDPGGNRASMLSCSALASREATSGNMSEDTDSTTREAAVLTRAVAMARLSILMVRGGLDVGVLPATMGPTGEVAYAGTALKRATCLAANAAWHEILVSLEAVRGVLGEAHPLSTAIALHTTQQRRRPASARFRTSVPSRDARQGYMDLLKAFAVAERSTSQTSQGGPGTAPFGQCPGVGASQYRGQSQSQSGQQGAPERPPLPPSKDGAAPLDLLAQPVPGTLPSASKNESSKAQDVVFGPGLRLVKHKGAVLEACAVRRQGAAAAVTPNATGTPLARDASSGSSPMCQQQSPALPSPLPEYSCAPASGSEPAAASTPAEAHVSMWLRPSMEDRLRSAPSLKRVLGSLD